MTKQKSQRTNLSLSPLSFDEAVTDLLKVKPPPKGTAKRRRVKRKMKKKRTTR